MLLLRSQRSGAPRGMPGIMRLGLLALAAVGALVLASGIGRLLPDLDIFGTERVDRSQPALLKSIARLSEYRAATANLQVIVDVEEDDKLLPSFIKGERTLFVAAGNVDAGVDFSRLGPGAVEVNDDRTAATLTLPAPRLYEAVVDPDRSRVFDRERGLLDRVGGLFEDSPTEEQALFATAKRKLEEAARADPQLLPAAERNTRAMLEGLLRGLGFDDVTIRFETPPV
jgi:hypothetical protein